ncbi:MAG TPA: sigma-70 family RNA polymerase sigma factor [Polyangiaceae bacterium]|nr:sigma-70 family RNA polymerase sigma factor [Polyangiaceae bacterium]
MAMAREQTAALIERFEGPLISYATRILGDRERARDVVQDTFVRLCETDEPLHGEVGPWLYAVCKHRAIDVLRRERRLASEDAIVEPAVEPDVEGQLSARELHAAIDALPDKERRVMRLRIDDHGYEHISATTGLTVNHVGVVIHQATRSLRARLAAPAIVTAAIVLALALAFRPAPIRLEYAAMPAAPHVAPAHDAPNIERHVEREAPPAASVAPSGPTPPPAKPQPPRARVFRPSAF